MTIEQLQYFIAIHQYGSFSNAALEMNITQSSLSKHILKLEQELDVQLFDRSNRKVKLTFAGEQLLNNAQDILNAYNTMMNQLKNIKEKSLNIAILPILSHYDISKKINLFLKQHPHIKLNIDEIEERDIPYLISNNKYDIYILRGIIDELKSFNSNILYSDSLMAIVSLNHPLAKKNFLNLNDLNNEKLLIPPKYTTIAKISLENINQNNIHPQSIKYGRMESIIHSAKENEGIALMMKKTLHVYHLSNIKAIPFIDDIHGDIILYTHPNNHNPLIKQFIDCLK